MNEKRWKQKANDREEWSSTETEDNTSILTALLSLLSKLSFMDFGQFALERYMTVHAMKL
jgi:hypothetical protein